MGRDSLKAAAQKSRSVLESRIARYYFLQRDTLTPLLHRELSDAIKLHEEGLQHLEIIPVGKEGGLAELHAPALDDVNNRVTEHWERLHGDMNSRAALLASLFFYQQFLLLRLLLDYGAMPPKPPSNWLHDKIATLDKYYSAADKSEEDIETYEKTVAQPLEELMFNRYHVEKRLRNAATVPSYPTGDVHRLIDQCDWPNLAAMLANDRQLAVTLFSGKPVEPKLWNDGTSKLVLRLIDSIQGRYFSRLSSPSMYTINKRARILSAKKAAQSTTIGSTGQHPAPATTLHFEASSAATATRNIYHKAVRCLGLGGKGPSPKCLDRPGSSATSTGSSFYSTAQLVDLREKAE